MRLSSIRTGVLFLLGTLTAACSGAAGGGPGTIPPIDPAQSTFDVSVLFGTPADGTIRILGFSGGLKMIQTPEVK